MNANGKIIFSQESYILTGLCFDVHNEKGRFAREKQYSDALEKKFQELHIPYVREERHDQDGNILDFVLYDKIVLEVKAKRLIERRDYYQLQRYLQSTNRKLGLLVNFRNRYLKPIRVIRIDTKAKAKFSH